MLLFLPNTQEEDMGRGRRVLVDIHVYKIEDVKIGFTLECSETVEPPFDMRPFVEYKRAVRLPINLDTDETLPQNHGFAVNKDGQIIYERYKDPTEYSSDGSCPLLLAYKAAQILSRCDVQFISKIDLGLHILEILRTKNHDTNDTVYALMRLLTGVFTEQEVLSIVLTEKPDFALTIIYYQFYPFFKPNKTVLFLDKVRRILPQLINFDPPKAIGDQTASIEEMRSYIK